MDLIALPTTLPLVRPVAAPSPSPAVPPRPERPARAGASCSGGFAERLRADLAVVDVQGWDGPVAARLLVDVRRRVVGPVLAASGLAGAAREQARATAWQEVWAALRGEWIRRAGNPWSALWTVARRAVHGEVVAASTLASHRKARRWTSPTPVAAANDGGRRGAAAPVTWASLEAIRELDADALVDLPSARSLGRRLDLIGEALVAAGWEAAVAVEVLEALVDVMDGQRSPAGRYLGWRVVAVDLSLPQWRVRRVQALVCGTPQAPGVLERMVVEGDQVLRSPCVRAALASTVVRSMRSPAPLLRESRPVSNARPAGETRCAS